MQKCIVHYDLDAFYVSVERLKDPTLKNKPLLVGGSAQRGVVSACSYETRRLGVHSAMPMHQAIRLCPDAIVVKGSRDAYSHYSEWVTRIIREELPLVQKASIDEFYADMSGMDTFFGCFQYAQRVRHRIVTETGLPVSFAVAPNKIVSKIATNECKPNGEMQVLPGTEEAFLSPLVIEKVPMIGQKTAAALRANGIQTIGDILKLSEKEAWSRLGKAGPGLLNRLKGYDEAPVRSFRQKKSISSENTFHANTNNEVFLLNELVRLVEKVGTELREDGLETACIGIKIKYDDFKVFVHQCQVEATALDHVIVRTAKELFRERYTPGRQVRLIGVRLSNFSSARQGSLFGTDNGQRKLYAQLDEIKNKYGAKIINRASSVIAYKEDHTDPENSLWIPKKR